MSEAVKYKMGWFPDLPDRRDYLLSIAPKKLEDIAPKLPPSVDLRNHTPILDQDGFNSCVAHAVMAAFMWLEQARTKASWFGSRMFIYKKARDMLHIKDDEGATVRAGVKAAAKYGVPPETMWPYIAANIYAEPTKDVFAEAKKARSTNYYRLDVRQATDGDTLLAVKAAVQKLPVAFGSTVYNSIFYVGKDGKIPLPSLNEEGGGHALLILGYDDDMVIQNEKGALLLQNSWGEGWGDGGYGWLPYQYILSGLTMDYWVIAEESQLKEIPFEITKPARTKL